MHAKPQQASAQVMVPAGFTGWWCQRCEKTVSLPEELGSPARCPKCHKPTAVWIPPTDPVNTRPLYADDERDRRPKDARGKELFDHIKHVIENPALDPDLRKIEDEEYKR